MDNKCHLLDLHTHNLLVAHVLPPPELLELVEPLEDGARFHAVRMPRNDLLQNSAVFDTNMVVANSKMELGAKNPQNGDAVEYQEPPQKLSPVAEVHLQKLKLAVGTCQRIAARAALSCNGPQLVEMAGDYIGSIVDAGSANPQDCYTRSSAEELTRTYRLSGLLQDAEEASFAVGEFADWE